MSSEPMTRIDEVVDEIHRIATWVPEAGITFNQFLIDDERPALIHTGMHELYEGVRNAVAEVLDPTRLAYVARLHLEADECGEMSRFWLEIGALCVITSMDTCATGIVDLRAGSIHASPRHRFHAGRYRMNLQIEGDVEVHRAQAPMPSRRNRSFIRAASAPSWSYRTKG